jgi:hypothetical protein
MFLDVGVMLIERVLSAGSCIPVGPQGLRKSCFRSVCKNQSFIKTL